VTQNTGSVGHFSTLLQGFPPWPFGSSPTRRLERDDRCQCSSKLVSRPRWLWRSALLEWRCVDRVSRASTFRAVPSQRWLGPGHRWGPPPWKGARLGHPASGPGALADPGRRLGARILDLLLLLPVFLILVLGALGIFGTSFGPFFPRESTFPSNGPGPTPGFVWLYLTVFACMFITGLVLLAYETIAVAKFGRTLGMAWLRIRPLRVSGGALGWTRSFARAAIFWLAGFLGWIGLLDPLWCLWDSERQCIHDKVADSIVINDAAGS
jgi:uncharacterized RDD family membrane protein YckC